MTIRAFHSSGFLALALSVVLPACTASDAERASVASSEGAENAASMNTLPDDGVDERPTDSPARVTTGVRADGDGVVETIQVEPLLPSSTIVVDVVRLEEVCADPSVFFATDEATLDQNAKETIAYLAECIRTHDVRSVHITGHADERGSESYNERLGRARAERVAEQLRKHGVTEPDIRVESMGEQGSRYSLFWPLDRRATIDTEPSS